MSRVLIAGGVSGKTERLVVANRCVWCAVPHWITDIDRQAHEQGAPTSHGACPEAARALLAQAEGVAC